MYRRISCCVVHTKVLRSSVTVLTAVELVPLPVTAVVTAWFGVAAPPLIALNSTAAAPPPLPRRPRAPPPVALAPLHAASPTPLGVRVVARHRHISVRNMLRWKLSLMKQ